MSVASVMSRMVSLFGGGASESWLEVFSDGGVKYVHENNGSLFARRGAETSERWISLDELPGMSDRYPAPGKGTVLARTFLAMADMWSDLYHQK